MADGGVVHAGFMGGGGILTQFQENAAAVGLRAIYGERCRTAALPDAIATIFAARRNQAPQKAILYR
jgi:hypothetical protein